MSIRCDVKTGYGFGCTSTPKFRVTPEYAIGRVHACGQHLAKAVVMATQMHDPSTAPACSRAKVTWLDWQSKPGDGNEARFFTEERTRYIRSGSGVLHLIGKGDSYSYTSCGMANTIGREAIPLQPPHAEDKHCRRCFPDWRPAKPSA